MFPIGSLSNLNCSIPDFGILCKYITWNPTVLLVKRRSQTRTKKYQISFFCFLFHMFLICRMKTELKDRGTHGKFKEMHFNHLRIFQFKNWLLPLMCFAIWLNHFSKCLCKQLKLLSLFEQKFWQKREHLFKVIWLSAPRLVQFNSFNYLIQSVS